MQCMKHFWTLLIALCCTLTVMGQRTKSDSTPPQKSTGTRAGTKDTGGGGQIMAVPSAKATQKDSDRSLQSARSGQVDSGRKNTQATRRNAIDSNKTHSGQAAAAGSSNNNNQSGDSSGSALPELSPAEQAARQQEAAAALIRQQKDSVYKARRTEIRQQLYLYALNKKGNAADYTLYFPDYFYENSNNGSGNGALVNVHNYRNRDLLFYGFLGITLLLGLIKIIFPRYFNQVFWFFLHPNDRKNNATEQIQGQHILPSLLLNLFFVLTGGLFLTQILRPGIPGANFWPSWLLFSGLLTAVYLVKYLVILLSGWVFAAPAAATIYNQVVFSINKIIGLILLPATVLISYGTNATIGHVFTTILIIISILLIYRYIASFLLIKGKLKVSAFHFILYLCAVEIIPLLLVYKVLLTNIGRFV
ncbi:protein of unknown function [Arachidicoccus rhizosphaerae]|uniref:DUF4271 domain-containing protein n=2 Tax=Arachidicoccus rhizosphaerae TaxID=551991 RepID=A0A1H4C179_9BACT|nr:protein of unknown function [Arachidicoccus rhizosphaerae]